MLTPLQIVSLVFSIVFSIAEIIAFVIFAIMIYRHNNKIMNLQRYVEKLEKEIKRED